MIHGLHSTSPLSSTKQTTMAVNEGQKDDSHPKNMFMLLCTPHVQPFKHVIPKQEGIDPNLKIYIYCQADGVSVRIYIYIDIDIDVYK